MRRPMNLVYLSTIAVLAASGFFLRDWPWWTLAVVGAIAMLLVSVAERVVSARRKRDVPSR
ncbi:hypothetical protein O7602_05875 [Micromonospora sp. WMMD1128]|uniref:hypothetical protein n=1 Tax=Micromonospora sp. WMMD1128 TaxID=3015150 RepID=UPI00248C478A|nr:hypothetical protein [Micromonospora sp. WMMD1128]WBB75055.1 hypothetical protein O7602_05875 [Micromonospora sp. WMMD1128]